MTPFLHFKRIQKPLTYKFVRDYLTKGETLESAITQSFIYVEQLRGKISPSLKKNFARELRTNFNQLLSSPFCPKDLLNRPKHSIDLSAFAEN